MKTSTIFLVSLIIAAVHTNFLPADGLYPLGSCEPRFLTCSGGIALIMDCPDDLIYHEGLEFCDWRHNIFACGRAEEASAESSGDASGDATEDGSGAEVEDGSGENSGESSGDELLENVCENLVNGVYSSRRCTNYYFICSSNTPRFLSCPTPLFYDPIQQKCSWKEAVEECQKEITTTAEEYIPDDQQNRDESSGSGSGHPIESCEDKSDGIYPIDECSETFLTCSEGISRIMDCPSTLFFHPSLLICDRQQNIIGCTGSPKPTPACEEDGYFSFGLCASSFTGCTNGRAIIMFCPTGLKFSQSTQMCDYEYNTLECEDRNRKDTLLIRDSAISTYDCAIDGLFSNSLCSRDYYRCHGGQLIKHECADANAVFSMIEGQCVDASNLAQCQ
ncbi:hypothetical protein GCK72_010550 [Caenorhabditis remanei]|uniref:Chitin-binding type-2 domain-containing protein n=1 Tax=Caenorhabditis remanei TaxID=31234 RepID=A0A6A5H3L4_CAERE|nr:hypothetical protein GCK72_010550 [Caenorhabditis remanei]KAF1762288.1 hypothetical protein GCK72_010550 [Caenorhabditis remanei]